MSCFFCGGPRTAPVRNESYYQLVSPPIGTMSLTRRFDGQPIIKVEIDTDMTIDAFACESICGELETHMTTAGQIENIKYCPFCGQKLWGR